MKPQSQFLRQTMLRLIGQKSIKNLIIWYLPTRKREKKNIHNYNSVIGFYNFLSTFSHSMSRERERVEKT